MDDDLPRPRGDAASQLAREPLDTYSQDELMERVALLEAAPHPFASAVRRPISLITRKPAPRFGRVQTALCTFATYRIVS